MSDKGLLLTIIPSFGQDTIGDTVGLVRVGIALPSFALGTAPHSIVNAGLFVEVPINGDFAPCLDGVVVHIAARIWLGISVAVLVVSNSSDSLSSRRAAKESHEIIMLGWK